MKDKLIENKRKKVRIEREIKRKKWERKYNIYLKRGENLSKLKTEKRWEQERKR